MITYTDQHGNEAAMSWAEYQSIEASGSAMYYAERDREPVAQAIELIRSMDQRPGKIAPGERPVHWGLKLRAGLHLYPPKHQDVKIQNPVLHHLSDRYRSTKCGVKALEGHRLSVARFVEYLGSIRACPECEEVYHEVSRYKTNYQRLLAERRAKEAQLRAQKKHDASPCVAPLEWTKDERARLKGVHGGESTGTSYRNGGPDKKRGTGKTYVR